MATLDDLWGGQLASVRFHAATHDCEIQVATLDRGQTNNFLLVCRGVTDLRFQNAIPEPWTYAELTEAHVSTDPATGEYLLELMIWSEDAGLAIRCAAIDVVGARG